MPLLLYVINTSQKTETSNGWLIAGIRPGVDIRLIPSESFIMCTAQQRRVESRSRGALKVERWLSRTAQGPEESTCFSALIPIYRHQALTSLLFYFTVYLNLMKNATPLSHPELPRLQTLNYGCCPQSWSMSTKWCTGLETLNNFLVLLLFVGLCGTSFLILCLFV